MQPNDISLPRPGMLRIVWQSGEISNIDGGLLRRMCPCSECSTRWRMASATYIPLETREATRIRSIDLIGSNRLLVIWEDGHDRSIYRFAQLHGMAPTIALHHSRP